MTNLSVVQHAINTKWSAKWVAKPAIWEDIVTRREHEADSGEDSLYYQDVTSDFEVIDYATKWRNYKHAWKFTCLSETRQNVQDMVEEIRYFCRQKYYPGPAFPTWNADEDNVICHLDLNEGTGNPADSTDNNHDFTLDGSNPPAWITTGAIHQKNYLRFTAAADATDDLMITGTLLDGAESEVSFEIVLQLGASFYTSLSADAVIFKKLNDSAGETQDSFRFFIDDTTAKPVFELYNAGTNLTLVVNGKIPVSEWVSVLMTADGSVVNLYLNGILVGSNIWGFMPGAGTSEDFTIQCDGPSTNQVVDICRFRVSNKARYPYDRLYVTKATSVIREQSNLYKTEVTVMGELFNVYVGGNV